MKIAIGVDHGGFECKETIIGHLRGKGFEVVDFGTDSPASCDYPVYGEKVARAVASGAFDRGVLICGTGIGISITANKVKGIRAACCSEPLSARLTRLHNDANIICFGGRIVGIEMAKAIVDAFFDAEFEGGGRHQKRIDLVAALEE